MVSREPSHVPRVSHRITNDTVFAKILKWARSNSLWYFHAWNGCCADEILNASGSRYDLERFGCLPQTDARHADLLVISGVVSHKIAPYLKSLYDEMLPPKYVMAIGSCANAGGPFASDFNYAVLPGANHIVPIDVYVPGCPPRPEAIMNGLIILQEKINGQRHAGIKNK